MSVDIAALTSEPWLLDPDGWCHDTDRHENQAGIVLLQNAMCIAMKRGWAAKQHPEKRLKKRWYIFFDSPRFVTILAREKTGYVHLHEDIATAFVETEKWYVANVESHL